MEKLIVQKKSLAYANDGASSVVTMDTITSLADGAVALFSEDGTLILYNSAASVFNEANIYVGNSSAGVMYMGTIYPNSYNYATSAYGAAATKTMCIGTNTTNEVVYNLNPKTLVIGETIGVQIIDLSKRYEDNSRYHNYEEQIVSGNTITTAVTRLVAKINADPNKCITSATTRLSTAVANGIVFAGKTLVDFTVVPTGLIIDADVLEYKNVVRGSTKGYLSTLTASLVAYGEGKNTYTQLLALEKATNPTIGDAGMSFDNDKLFTLPSRLESGTTYSSFVFTCKAPNNISKLINVDNPINTYTFVAYSGDTGNTYLAPLLANVNTVLAAKKC